MIKPYLRDLINNHKPTIESNNEENNEENDSAEWKIQLVIQNNFISDKNLEDTQTIYSASKPVETFMDSDTENAIDTLFNTILERIPKVIETSNERGSGFAHESAALSYYYFQKINIRTGGSYKVAPNWTVSKKATINPKNEKDNNYFQWSTISGLSYNKIKEKELKKILKFKRDNTDFSSHQRNCEEREQNNTSVAINILFIPHNNEEIKLAYKSNYNKRKNK